MSAGWIEGRFEGIYSGPRRPPVDSRSKHDRSRRIHAASEPKRFGFEIESGRVHDLTTCSEFDPETIEDDQLIRQDRVRRVRLSEAGDADVDRETSLFDVYLCDWQLKHPAEAGGRAYGTIIGTIRARRRPFAEKPSTTIEPVRPQLSGGQKTRELENRMPTAPPVRDEAREPNEPALVATKLGWAEVALLVALAFTGIGYACGATFALIWVAPIATALGLVWLKPDGIVRGAPTWMVSAPAALQLLVLASPLAVSWKTGCWPMFGSLQLALLATPLLLSVAIGSRGSLWITCAVWTAVTCSHCAGGNTDSCMTVAASDAGAALDAQQPTDRAGRRTDEQGRWPVMPPASPSDNSQGPDLASESSRVATLGLDISPNMPSGPIPSIPAPAPTRGPTPSATTTTPTHTPPAPKVGPVPTNADVTTGDHRLTHVDGGWLSPDHRRAPREHVLISIEQANRTPALFFESRGAHRVYLPTDPIFEDASSSLRRDAPVVLARIAALLSLPSQPRVVLEVHSDSAGAPENQVALTRRRAESVRGWLVERGHIPSSRFEMLPIGGARPLVPPDGDYGAQQPNRRIEIRIVDQG